MTKTIILCGILAIIVFCIQLVLCNKAKTRTTKLIPVYFIILLYLVAIILYVVDVINGSGGVAIWAIFSFVISVANTVSLAADGLAWLFYKYRLRHTEHNRRHKWN